MERVRLGKTGIEVSRLGIGTGTAHPYRCSAVQLSSVIPACPESKRDMIPDVAGMTIQSSDITRLT